jgi:hypothetical protein
VLEVTLIPVLLDFAVTPVVEATLTYADRAHNVLESHTFALTRPDILFWRVPLQDPAVRGFTTKFTYNTADGRVIEGSPTPAPDDKVTIPKLLVPEVSCLMVARLVDFAVTPVVEVDISYTDPAHQIDTTESFIFTDTANQQWRQRTAPDGPKTFVVQITYHLATGAVVPREPATLSTPKIVIPKFLPAS